MRRVTRKRAQARFQGAKSREVKTEDVKLPIGLVRAQLHAGDDAETLGFARDARLLVAIDAYRDR